jgi:hypothetical protein
LAWDPHLVYNRLDDTVNPLNAALEAAHTDYLLQLESLRMVVALRKAEGENTFAITHELAPGLRGDMPAPTW